MKLDEDFAAGFEDSKFDEVKPVLKVLTVLIIVGACIYGGIAFMQKRNDTKPQDNLSATATDSDAQKLSQYVDDAINNNPVPETSDGEFYKKLIAGYDSQLNCYNQYPDIAAEQKARVEELKKGALDTSGSYKDSYIASGGAYSHTSAPKNETTGCSYALSESEYLKCTDTYNSQHNTSVSSTKPSAQNQEAATSTSSSTTPTQTVAPPTSTTPSTSNPQLASLNECLSKAQQCTTEASKSRAVQVCYQAYNENQY